MSANAFLAAITAEPEEDTPRLVFADWLDEEGQPARAEFIRVQCEIARLPAWSRKAKLLRFRERQLLIRHGEEWRAELPKLAGVTWGRFERGFVCEVAVNDLNVLKKKAGAIRAAAPVVGVELESANQVWTGAKPLPWLRWFRPRAQYGVLVGHEYDLIECPVLRTLTRLDLSACAPSNALVARLAGSDPFPQLEELALSNGGAGDSGLSALARASVVPNLRVLRINSVGGGYTSDPYITATSLRFVAESPALKNLTTLELWNQRLSDEAVRTLLTGATFAKLESVALSGSALTARAFDVPAGPARWRDLDLTQCMIGNDGAAALARLPQFSELGRLRASGCELGAPAITALAKAPLAKTLGEFDLSHNPVRANGVAAFAGGKWPELHTLNLSGSGLGGEAVKELPACGFAELLDLSLSDNDLGAGGAIALGRAPWAAGLRRLNLTRSRCAAGAALAGCSNFANLQELNLRENALGRMGVSALAKGKWSELTDLNLDATDAGDEGVEALVRSGLVARLLSLSVAKCGLSGDALKALEREAPHLVRLQLGNVGLAYAIGTRNEFGNDAVAAFASAKSFPRLRFLALAGCGLGYEGSRALVEGRLFKHLLRLDVGEHVPTGDVLRKFRELNAQPLSADWTAAGF